MQKYAQLISKYTLCVVDWWELGRRAKIDREEWNGYGQWYQKWEGAADWKDIKGRR